MKMMIGNCFYEPEKNSSSVSDADADGIELKVNNNNKSQPSYHFDVENIRRQQFVQSIGKF